MATNRNKISVSLSDQALRTLDAEADRRGWQRPATLDWIITTHPDLEEPMAKRIRITNMLHLRDNPVPLYQQYPGQSEPQGAFLELDPAERTAYAGHNPEIGSAVPMQVWHGVLIRIPLPCDVYGPALADWLEWDSVQSRLAEICDGHGAYWDGSNHVGRLTEQAVSACDSLQLEAEQLERRAVWDAVVDWLSPAIYTDEETGEICIDGTDIRISPTTSDEELQRHATELAQDGGDEFVLFPDDIRDYLQQQRDSLVEDAS